MKSPLSPSILVLGPVGLLTDEGPMPIGSRLERLLLATLTLSANHTVSADQLAEVLWGESPPPSRDNTLHSLVSRLRHGLGPARIASEDHGYRLLVGTDDIDALVFEALVAEAAEAHDRPGSGLAICRRALRLWRGTPFGEFADADPFRLEALRLDELRLFAMELQLEYELALGEGEVVVASLEGLVEEHPYRERMWYLLMTALSKVGRRVEALRAFRQLTDSLAEVGLEPSEDLRRLEERILLEDATVRPRLELAAEGDEPVEISGQR